MQWFLFSSNPWDISFIIFQAKKLMLKQVANR